MLKVAGLKKSYGDQLVLDDVSFEIGRGAIHGIVGENGAGKTTLFKCIAGLESYQGTVTGNAGILKNVTGYLPTNPFFFSKMTGYEYLRLLCDARKIRIRDFDQFNLFDLPLKRYAEGYSTGMQKKLALTGILLQKNELFILDEPFNGVDIASNLMINAVLLKLKSLDKTILMSSHIFSSLQDTCGMLHYLKNGRIVASVPKAEFYKVEAEMKGTQPGTDIIDSMYL